MLDNRINGSRVNIAPADPVPGEWIRLSTVESIGIDGQDAGSFDYLVCDADGDCHGDGGGLVYDRSACLPEDAEAIDRLGDNIAMFSRDLKWECLLEVGVVDPGWQKDLERNPLERDIKECLPYLRNVFHRPIRHLSVDNESVLTAKARRLATGAPDYLAAHPEDWDGRTVLGVKPKYVLAKVRHEELDIYENRLAAQLVDHLSHFLARRVHQLRKIENMLVAVDEFSDSVRGSHWLQGRISRLWGRSVQPSSLSLGKARDLQKELMHLRKQLLGLMDTELYTNIPRRTKISGQIRITNILRDDANYRFVAKLWRRWFGLAGGSPETADAFYLKMQKMHNRHAQVTTMYVAQALTQLGFTKVRRDADLMQTGSEIIVTREEGENISISLQSQADKTLLVQIGDEPVLRITPIFFGFLDVLTERAAQACIQALQSRAPDVIPCLVVFPGSISSGRSPLSESIQHRLTFSTTNLRAGRGGIKFLAVSPYDITSTERLARSLRWHITSRHLLKYPFHLLKTSYENLDRHGCLNAATKALQKMEGGFCIKRPNDVEVLIREIDAKCKDWEREKTAGEGSVAQLEEALKGKHHDPSFGGQVRVAKEKAKSARLAISELDSLKTELRKAVSHTRSLMTCPCCGKVNAGAVGVDLRDNGTFGIRCEGCECEWGLHLCGGCHERFPYIQISGIEGSLDGNKGPGWEEMSIGQDMLATPRLQADGSVRFECPWCGYV